MTIYSINNNKRYGAEKSLPRRSSVFKKNQNQGESFHLQHGSNWGVFLSGIGVLTVIIAVGFLYIFQITTSAVNGYDTTSLEKQIGKLQEERRTLEMQVADLQSVRAIEIGAKKLKLIAVPKVAFTSPIINDTVAYFVQNSEL